MDDLLKRLIASNFADLKGLNVTGDIPVKQEVINEFIAAFLKDGLPGSSSSPTIAGTSAAAPNPVAGVNPNALLKLVRDLKVTADEGRVNIHFVVGVD